VRLLAKRAWQTPVLAAAANQQPPSPQLTSDIDTISTTDIRRVSARREPRPRPDLAWKPVPHARAQLRHGLFARTQTLGDLLVHLLSRELRRRALRSRRFAARACDPIVAAQEHTIRLVLAAHVHLLEWMQAGPFSTGGGTRHVQLVRGEGRDVSSLYRRGRGGGQVDAGGERDAQ